MHIKFLGRGKGKGSTATNYIMSEQDHTKKPRPIQPIVLRGNPKKTGELADSLDFKHKYRSCVIAFHPDDKPTSEQLNEVLNEFEKIAFAGLEPDQYDWTAVLHREADSEHIHIIVPRVELSTGKSMNIAPPGWKNTFDPLRDLFNEKNNWVSPDISLNPSIARITQPSAEGTHKSKPAGTRAEIKKSIESYLLDEIQQGNVQNRDDIIQSLHGLGLETPRAGNDYITVLDAETKTRTRLKGAIYEKSWQLEQSLERASEPETQGDRASNKGRIAELERELENRIQERTKYNQQRYPRPEPKPQPRLKRKSESNQENEEDVNGSMDTAAVDSLPDLLDYLGEQLGSDAILDAPHSEPAISDKRERSKNNDSASTVESDKPENMRQPALRPDRREHAILSKWLQDFKEKIRDIYDRTRAEIVRRIESFIESIRGGYEAATATSDDLNITNKQIDQAIQHGSTTIERGVRKMRENRNDELERFKTQINLVEYAASQGYELVKKDSSKNSKALKHPGGDKIIVATDMDGHGIYFSVGQGDNGSIIDFIQNRENKNLGQVRKELRNFGGFTDIQDYKSYSKPLKSSKDIAQAAYVLAQSQVTDVHPYLLNERKISIGTLKDPRFNKSVKIDDRNNALFPHFNKSGVSGYEAKNKEYTAFAKGGERGLWYSSNIMRAERVVIVESAIDALSHAELKETSEETAYVSIAGSMSSSQLELIKKVVNGKKVIIATDNDKSGEYYAEQIKEVIPDAVRETAQGKDWNEDLKVKRELDSDRELEPY